MYNKALICMESGSHSTELATCISGLLDIGIRECLVTQFLTYNEAVAASLSVAEAELKQHIEGLRQQLQEAGFSAEAKTAAGFSYRQAYRLAWEHGCDLVVVECRYDTIAGELVGGGIAASIIHHLALPTLLLRMDVSDSGSGKCVQGKPCDFTGHALYPTDFSENADRAFTSLEELVAHGIKQVTLMHVQDRVRILPHLREKLNEFNDIDSERLKYLEDRLRKKGVPSVETRLSFGNPTVEILKVVRKMNPSLVVMGSQGRGFVSELFLGSVSHNMSRLSPAPMLLIPPRR
jgi:nucleotide-binding universal stress UspA family protein